MEWKQRHLKPEGEIIDVLGKIHAPDAEFKPYRAHHFKALCLGEATVLNLPFLEC